MSGPDLFAAFFENGWNRWNCGTETLKPAEKPGSSGSTFSDTQFHHSNSVEPVRSNCGTEKHILTHRVRRPGSTVPPVPRKIEDVEREEREAIMIEDGGIPAATAGAFALLSSAPCPADDDTRWQAAIDMIGAVLSAGNVNIGRHADR